MSSGGHYLTCRLTAPVYCVCYFQDALQKAFLLGSASEVGTEPALQHYMRQPVDLHHLAAVLAFRVLGILFIRIMEQKMETTL